MCFCVHFYKFVSGENCFEQNIVAESEGYTAEFL